MVDESVKIYNRQKTHLVLGMKTPDEIHRAFVAAINVRKTVLSGVDLIQDEATAERA